MNIYTASEAFYEDFHIHFGKELGVINSYEQIEKADLIIFTGGEDISPSIYGEKRIKTTFTNPHRDARELVILKYALERNKKILGICRGHQLINACLGGKLIQHIYPPHSQWHKIIWNKNEDAFHNLLYQHYLINEKLFVNSYHHQAVKIPGKNMEILAINAVDKIIEATGNKSNILTVQWHPEFAMDERFFQLIKEWIYL